MLKRLLGDQNDHLKKFVAFGHQKEPIKKMQKSKFTQHQNSRIICKQHAVLKMFLGVKMAIKNHMAFVHQKGSIQKIKE